MIAQTELTPAEVDRINSWVDKGILKHLPPEQNDVGETFVNWEVVNDLRQDVWVRLLPVIRLPDGCLNTRQACGFGQSAARDYVRDRAKTQQFPLLKLPNGEISDEPFENTIIDDSGDRNIEQLIDGCIDDERAVALEDLKEDHPNDYGFLIKTALKANARLGPTPAERYRMRDIRLRMAKKNPGVFGRIKGAPRKRFKKVTHEPKLLAESI
jgi:hypothetical protein